MDPDACFWAMYEAMREADFHLARTHALDLKGWLDSGGFYPKFYSKPGVDAYLASVLHRTAHLSEE